MLDPDVVLRSDGGKRRRALSFVRRGAAEVARTAITSALPTAVKVPALVNGAAGVVVMTNGRPFVVMGFTVRAARLWRLTACSIRNGSRGSIWPSSMARPESLIESSSASKRWRRSGCAELSSSLCPRTRSARRGGSCARYTCVTGAGGTLSSEVIRQLEQKAPFRAAYFSDRAAEMARARGLTPSSSTTTSPRRFARRFGAAIRCSSWARTRWISS